MVYGLCIRRLPVSVMLVFVWSSSVVIPVSVLVAVVPGLKAIISLIKPVIVLVTSVSTIVSAEVLPTLIVTQVPIVVSEIWSRNE